MKPLYRHPLAGVIALAVIATACETDDTADDFPAMDAPEMTAPAETPPTDPITTDEAATAQFTAVGGSGASGTLQLEPVSDGTHVTVTLSGAGEGVHQGHVHTGTCDSPGSVVTALEPITTDAAGSGRGESHINVPLSQLRDGQHVVLYHEADGAPGAPIACAQIPSA